jgi:hypothetical protein
LGDATFEHGGKLDCMWQAKRKARKRAVTDIGDSANEKPAGGERRHFYIASSRRKFGPKSRSMTTKKKHTFERTPGAQGEQ